MPSNPLADAAIARIEESLKGKPIGPKSLTGNIAGDVVVMCAMVAAPDGVVNAILMGAANNRAEAEVYQDTDHLRHALKCAKGG